MKVIYVTALNVVLLNAILKNAVAPKNFISGKKWFFFFWKLVKENFQ